MAEILTTFTPELVFAICDRVQDVSDHCLGKQIISIEVYEKILQSTTTSDNAERARTLLIAVKDAVSTDQTVFEVMMEILTNVLFSAENVRLPPFMLKMERQYEDLKWHSRSRKRKRTNSDPTEMDQELATPLKVSKLITNNQPDTIFIFSKNIIIEMFAERLISATSSSITPLCDQYVANGLISNEVYRRLREAKGYSEQDKAISSLQAIMENIEKDDQCFDIFLTTLNSTLPTAISSKLVAEIIEESENYTLLPSANNGSPCYQASEMKANSCDIHSEYQKATTRLDEARRDIEKLQQDLALENQENEKLKDQLSKLRAEGREEENAKEIEELKKMITEREHEISRLRKKIKEKEKEVEFWDMKVKRERKVFQEKSGLASHMKVKESKMEVSEKLKVCNQDLEKEFEELQQTMAKVREECTKLKQETDDIQKTKNTLLRENRSLKSNLWSMRDSHSDCIKRSVYNPCYCGIMGSNRCPRRHT